MHTGPCSRHGFPHEGDQRTEAAYIMCLRTILWSCLCTDILTQDQEGVASTEVLHPTDGGQSGCDPIGCTHGRPVPSKKGLLGL
jgi:hypothetical protein